MSGSAIGPVNERFPEAVPDSTFIAGNARKSNRYGKSI